MRTLEDERFEAIALLQAGRSVHEVAEQLNRTRPWVRKWRDRWRQEGYAGLSDRSRAPKLVHNRTPCTVRERTIQARMALEKRARNGEGLKYIGARAIRHWLREQGDKQIPSVPTIERILREAGLTQEKAQRMEKEIAYPHLSPQRPHQLIQVDIVPHFLRGGKAITCFNAIDVVSHYPVGRSYDRRRSTDAAAFLVHVWQTLGIPQYTQVDNEGCFSGGHTHPYVLGKVIRLALSVGTELLFSPFYHPASNYMVERFHQDYSRHVWQDSELGSLQDINQAGERFLQDYRCSRHLKSLKETTPQALHLASAPNYLDADFVLSSQRLPLRPGKVHFLRCVGAEGTIRLLNVDWSVPAPADTGVWATLSIQPEGAWLRVYDAAPDVQERRCLIAHPFPLAEAILPWTSEPDGAQSQEDRVEALPPALSRSEDVLDVHQHEEPPIDPSGAAEQVAHHRVPMRSHPGHTPSLAAELFALGLQLFQQSLIRTVLLTDRLLE